MPTDNIHVLARAVVVDEDHILLCQPFDLPISFYFLPGGHVEHGESVQSALIRELQEETGAITTIKRFLGCLEYSFVPGHNSICHNHEINLIFEAESPMLKRSIPLTQREAHIGLVWMPLVRLNEIDLRAEPFKTLIPQWLNRGEADVFHSEVI